MTDSELNAINRLQSQVRNARSRFRGEEPSQTAPEVQAGSDRQPTASPDLKAIGRMRDSLEAQAHRLLLKSDTLDTEARGFKLVERTRVQPLPEEPADAAAPAAVLAQLRFGQGHVSIVIADPPDVDEMTGGQRALATLAAVEGAAGVEYLGDSGWIRLVLRGSMTVEEIMRVLRDPLRGRLEIESVSEEKRQIRLRYSPDVAPEPNQNGLETRRWLRH